MLVKVFDASSGSLSSTANFYVDFLHPLLIYISYVAGSVTVDLALVPESRDMCKEMAHEELSCGGGSESADQPKKKYHHKTDLFTVD